MLYGASEYGSVEYCGINQDISLNINISDTETLVEEMLREMSCLVSPGGSKGIQIVTP